MIIYIAGPMTGIENFNFPAFHRAARQLEAMGYMAINPAAKESYVTDRLADPMKGEDLPDPKKIPVECGGQDATSSLAKLHLTDFYQLLDCDAVILIEGWATSKGARAEALVGQLTGKTLYLLSPHGVMSAFPERWTIRAVVDHGFVRASTTPTSGPE